MGHDTMQETSITMQETSITSSMTNVQKKQAVTATSRQQVMGPSQVQMMRALNKGALGASQKILSFLKSAQQNQSTPIRTANSGLNEWQSVRPVRASRQVGAREGSLSCSRVHVLSLAHLLSH